MTKAADKMRPDSVRRSLECGKFRLRRRFGVVDQVDDVEQDECKRETLSRQLVDAPRLEFTVDDGRLRRQRPVVIGRQWRHQTTIV